MEAKISTKNGLGEDELYYEMFQCPNCSNSKIGIGDKYCSDCGSKIEWYDHTEPTEADWWDGAEPINT